MEQNLQVITMKIRSWMHVMFFMLKKGISKTKVFVDLNMMMKRGKIVGKALNNLLFHHHHNWAVNTFHHHHHPHHLPSPSPSPSSDEYEFSCTTTPQYPLSLFSTNKKHQKKNHHGDTPDIDMNHDDIIINDAASVIKALEMLTISANAPALPKFGKSPMVKQLRITDSPFPLSNVEGDGKVDEAAEKFIMRFYNDLRRQN